MASSSVLVITGVGGMGLAVAQRLGAGKTILLADFSSEILEAAAAQLKVRGHTAVHTQRTDVSSAESVGELAAAATALGTIETVVHTAGLGPSSEAVKVYGVNLIGTALVIDAFQPIIAPGGSAVCIASLAGHLIPHFSAEQAIHFGLRPAGPELLQSSVINIETDSGAQAYTTSKAANIQRVKASASGYGTRGARINSISPGFVSTTLAHANMGEEQIRVMVEQQPIQRVGTVDDIAEAVAFLTGPGASWITGTDLIIDGGTHAGLTRRAFLAGKLVTDLGSTSESQHEQAPKSATG